MMLLLLPDFRTVSYHTPFTTDPLYCKQWDDVFNINNKILHETCTKVWPAYLATVTKLDHARERIAHIMEKEIPAVIPNFKLKPLECNTVKIPHLSFTIYMFYFIFNNHCVTHVKFLIIFVQMDHGLLAMFLTEFFGYFGEDSVCLNTVLHFKVVCYIIFDFLWLLE